jgi:hypothetical protein
VDEENKRIVETLLSIRGNSPLINLRFEKLFFTKGNYFKTKFCKNFGFFLFFERIQKAFWFFPNKQEKLAFLSLTKKIFFYRTIAETLTN